MTMRPRLFHWQFQSHVMVDEQVSMLQSLSLCHDCVLCGFRLVQPDSFLPREVVMVESHALRQEA